MAKGYYYFVAGLPSITMEDAKPAKDMDAFQQDVREHIDASDYELVELLFLQADCVNLLTLMFHPEREWQPYGTIPRFVLEAEIAKPQKLPKFMIRFIQSVKLEQPVYPGVSWDNQLTWLFYDEVLACSNSFIHEWYEFDMDINNLLTAILCRRNKLPYEKEIIGTNWVSESLRQSHAQDFGLGKHVAHLERIFQLAEMTDILEREKAVDQLKWKWVEDRNFFHYFDIDLILGYVARVQIAARWQQMDAELGKTRFQQILDDLEESFQFSEDFTLKKEDRV